MKRLLSVDFDFFFPIAEDADINLYDWGHNENLAIMLRGIWTIRASAFLQAKKELPGTSGEEKTFWNRFKFADDATLYFSESHSAIYKSQVMAGIEEIWNFDAHHDAYQTRKQAEKTGFVDCQNWATILSSQGVKVTTFYPTWKDWAVKMDRPKDSSVKVELDPQKPFKKPFERIFLCRSGAWVPTWLDEKFWEFVEECPAKNKVSLDNLAPRQFSLAEAQEQADSLKKFLDGELCPKKK